MPGDTRLFGIPKDRNKHSVLSFGLPDWKHALSTGLQSCLSALRFIWTDTLNQKYRMRTDSR